MSLWLALLAWALAAQALHLRGHRRLVQVARAGHELRGPLSAAQLALDGLERSARVEAIELELQAELFESPEKHRRMTAFLEKRRP